MKDQLKELEEQLASDVITEEEYEQKKKILKKKRIKNALLTIFGFFLLCLIFLMLGFEYVEPLQLPLSGTIILSFIVGTFLFLIMELGSKIFGKKEKREERMPKGFLKKCIKCGREIPIASEECPFCKTIQDQLTLKQTIKEPVKCM